MEESPIGFVAIKEEVYLKIAEVVLTHANPYKMKLEDFKEVIGFLGGRVVVGNCKINEVIISHVGTNTDVQLQAKHYVEATDFESQLYIKNPPEFLVGWWHSHFIGHQYSGIDVINQIGWQHELNPHAIGLVFDPQLISEKNPGIAILKLEDPSKGEASPVQSVDFVIQMPSPSRDNYLLYLKQKLPQFFT